MRKFPNEGCKQAFDCGKEYVLAGGSLHRLAEALEFCETPEEETFFLLGCVEEIRDVETVR